MNLKMEPSTLRRLGYTSDQAAIMRRYIREQQGWKTHLENTRQAIVEGLLQHKAKTLRILGSGYLLDIPVEEILQHCSRLVLTDIIHPPQVVHKFSGVSSVVFDTVDLNGGLANFIGQRNARRLTFFELESFIRNITLPTFDEDLVVSLNLLSQLNDIPIAYLRRKGKLSAEQLHELAGQIQQRHVDQLPVGRTLLVSDYEEEYYNEDEDLVGANPTVFVRIPGCTIREWSWQFDTQMTYHEDFKTVLRVTANQW